MKPIKAYLNILKLRVNMALGRRVLDNYPIVAFIEPTLFCNLRCPTCPTGLRLGLRPACAISWDQYKCILDEIGDYLFGLNLYNWGEPLLHKQTPEFIQYAKSKGILVALSTNLSINLSDEYIFSLVRSGLDNLIVSLDGATEDSYVKYRRGGDFTLVWENIRRIQSVKRSLGTNTPIITWQFLVFQHNEHEIETVKSNYKIWGADRFHIGIPFVPPKPYDKGFEPSTIPQYQHNQGQMESKHRPRIGRPCPWLYGIFVLNPNGMVSPCCGCLDEKDDFAVYSPSRGFFDAWNSEKFTRARSLFAKPQKQNNSNSVRDAWKHNIDRRLDTMGTSDASLSDRQLLCYSCTMTRDQQTLLESFIASTIVSYIGLFLRKRNMQYCIGFLLLLLVSGTPFWKRSALFILSRISNTIGSLKPRILGLTLI
jgi:MoaA/NifB/PqqE/SkfB family radical SAM enzyme